MSIEKTKEQLHHLLKDNGYPVIALSGKWGTGKSHLWDEVRTESVDTKVNKAVYVSLFGLSTIDQVKRKLIERTIPIVEGKSPIVDGFMNIIDVGLTAGAEHFKALAAIKDVNLLLMAPVALKEKVIVIDDIERKHEKLGIDEVLGFIDEYSKQYKTRFVLILNDDHLSQKEEQKALWTTFREKVIDQEIKLSTTPKEAYCIASKLNPSKYSEAIKQASVKCSLTNIRVISKIIRIINKLLLNSDLSEPIQHRVIPSVVLFSAIHFRGLIDGPDFEFALNIGESNWDMVAKHENHEPSAKDKQEINWRLFMNRLGIYGCDEFEHSLVNFLESGLLDIGVIEPVIERYKSEHDYLEAKQSVHNFIQKVLWDYRLTEKMLIDDAKALVDVCYLLDCSTVSNFCFIVEKYLSVGAQISDEAINKWVKHNQSTSDLNIPFDYKLHPKIQEHLDAMTEECNAKKSVLDVVLYIYAHSSWSTVHSSVLKKATTDDFEYAIRNTENIEDFKDFMLQMTEFAMNRTSHNQTFGTAVEHFIQACKNIVNNPDETRLGSIIKTIFENRKLEVELK